MFRGVLSTQHVQFAFGNGGDCSSYVKSDDNTVWPASQPQNVTPQKAKRKARTFFDRIYKMDQMGILFIRSFCLNLRDCHDAGKC